MTSNITCDIVNEDTVKCIIYNISTESDDDRFWEKLCDNLNKTIQNLSRDYIWHRDEFRLNIPLHDNFNDDIPSHLESITCFGDNIEDEWFIVYLVFKLTKQFTNIIVQIVDNDGEFLLIEAADCLPFWAKPDNTENRVFIYNNHIHLITKNVNSQLSIKEAINIVVSEPNSTRAPQIQEIILQRITGYPQKIKDCLHQAVVKLPINIATVLTMNPSLISPFVTTYCSHDVIDAKSCKKVDYTNCISTEVKFTKCLYAMLVHSKSINSLKHINVNFEKEKKSFLGFKLTCGFQMIMSKTSDNLFSSKEYNKFLKSLKLNGYFKDNIEGSRAYTQLLERAQTYFLHMESPISSCVSNSITKLMSSDDFLRVKEIIMNKKEEDLEEDKDDWLNIHPEQLNDLLNKRYGKKSTFENDDMINSQTMTSKLSDFLKKTSDFEGIEQIDEETDTIDFDCDEFVNSVEKMLNLLTSNNNDDDETDSELDGEIDISQKGMSIEVESELAEKLVPVSEGKGLVLENIVKSMKEEEGSSGPASNLLKTIGINKLDVLDSDDD